MSDKHFFKLCNLVAENSNCLSRKIGAVLARNNRILAFGWNHTPDRVQDCSYRYVFDQALLKALKQNEVIDTNICPRRSLGYRSGEGLEWCIAEHAERDCLIQCAKYGIATDGSTLYCNSGVPCQACMVELLDAGVQEIVCKTIDYYDEMSKFLYKQSGIRIRTFML